jgi:hypothetical protein
MFSEWIVRGLAAGDPRHVEIQARQFGYPVYAANLGLSLAHRTSEADYMRAIDALIDSRGDVINRFVAAVP